MTKTFSAREAGIAVMQAAKNKIDALSVELARLQKTEAEGLALQAMRKSEARRTIFKTLAKAETFIDTTHRSDPEKRDVTVGQPGPTLPGQRSERSVSQPGSGGETKKDTLVKAAGDPSKPPAVPMAKPPPAPKQAVAAPSSPALPKPAKPMAAPGAAPGMAKCEKGVFGKLKMNKGAL